MNAKKTLVSFLLVASVLFLVATVSAADFTVDSVKIDGIEATDATVNAGDTISVRVELTSDCDAKDVVVKAEFGDVEVRSSKFVVEANKTYKKVLTLKVPFDFKKDEVKDLMDLEVSIEGEEIATGNDFENSVEYNEVTVLKQPYNIAVKSVITSNAIKAGETFPVDIVLKNIGYNDVDDVYVSVKIPELNIEKKVYFGEIFAIEDNSEDEENTANGRVSITIPYDAKSGVYTLLVEVENDETKNTAKKEITIENSVSEIAMKSGNDLILLNPTSQLMVYKVMYQSKDVTVVVPAVSSKTVPIEVPTSGDYDFDVSVFAGEKLLSTVKFSGSSQSEIQLTNPVFVLTVILAIVFLVLLVALVVLITKKPQKTEEFGESYY